MTVGLMSTSEHLVSENLYPKSIELLRAIDFSVKQPGMRISCVSQSRIKPTCCTQDRLYTLTSAETRVKPFIHTQNTQNKAMNKACD